MKSPIKKEFFFEKVLQNLQSDIAILDNNGRYLYVNAYAIADPVTRQWIIGKTDLEYCQFKQVDVNIAHNRRDKFKQAIDTRNKVEWEEALINSKGEKKLFIRTVYPVYDEIGKDIHFLIGHGLDITERRKTRDELEASRRFMDTVLNASPQLIFVKDREGRFLMANKSLADLFNLTVNGIVSKNNAEVHLNKVEIQTYSKNDLTVIEKREMLRTLEPFTQKNGARIWFDTVKVPLVEPDGTVNVLGILTDVTENKLKDDRLRLSEQQLAEAQQLTKSGNWVRHLKNDKIEWSNGMYSIWERPVGSGPPSLEEVMNSVSTEYQLMINDAINEIIETKVEKEFTYEILLPSGRKTLKTLARVLEDESGTIIGIFGSVMDITVQMNTEKQLLLNEKKLNEAQLLAKMGNYEWDAASFTTIYSKGCYEIFEWNSDEQITSNDAFEKLVHPDDLSGFKKNWEKFREGNGTLLVDVRIITRSGQLKFLHTLNNPTFDAAGEMVKVFGIIQDITEQKQAEELLRQNEQKLNEAQELSRTGSFEFNLSTGDIKWSSGMYLIWEIDSSTVPNLDLFYKYLHKDDVDRVRKIEMNLHPGIEQWLIKYRIITPAGNEKHIEVLSKINKSPDGSSAIIVGSCIDITNRVLNEEKLLLNEQRLFEAQELSNSGSWEVSFYPTINMVWSPGTFKIWDMPVEGPTLDQEEFYKSVVEADRARVISTYRKLRDTGEPIELQFKVITKQNNEKVFSSRGKAIKDAYGKVIKIYGTNTDITERILIEERLRMSEQNLLQAQKMARLGSWHLDFKTKELVWTEGMYAIWERKYSSTSPTWKELKSTIHADDLDQFEEAIMMITNSNSEQIVEFRIILPDGKVKFIEGRGGILKDSNGLPTGIYGTVMDINDMKHVEEELIRARVQAEESSKAKEYFLANISHELRTPLNGILGMSRLLQKSALNSTQREYVDVLYRAAENLLVIINDVLDFAKIEAGKLSLEEINFDPVRVADTAINLQMFKAEEKDIALRHIQDKDSPIPVVTGDPYRLNQILLNLLNNAIKFTNSGEVVLTHRVMEEDEVSVKILFSVKDTGIGIPKELFKRIFESFTQADPFGAKHGGVGLGLTISKNLVEKQNGQIWVESEMDVGSTFNFFIPYRKARTETLGTSDKALPVLDLGLLHILLAEDNKVNLFITEAMLRDWGFKVDVAFNGVEAVELMKANSYDLVLMDIQMPEMNGLEATKKIRQLKDARKSAVPILAITANTSKQAHKQFLAEGMNDWVIKPFKEETLYKKIARHIRGKNWISGAMQQRKFPVRKKPVHDVLPLYDLSMLKKDSPENSVFLKRMLTIFIESIPAIVDKMLVHFDRTEMDTVSTLAHKIKPTIDSAGIVSLKETIRNIEGYREKKRSKDQLETDLLFLKESIDKVSLLFEEEIQKLKV